MGEAAGGRLEEGFTDFSGLVGLEDEDDEDFLTSDFLDFFSVGPLKPEVVWPSDTLSPTLVDPALTPTQVPGPQGWV